MAKTIFAIATALLVVMTVFASAAEACISCSYVPEVVNSPSKSYSAKRHKKKRVNRAAKKRKALPAKKRIVKKKTTTKKVETAKTAPIKTEVENENSTVSTASLPNDETIGTETKKVETVKTAPIKTKADNENSTISTASLAKDETIKTEIETKAKDEPKVTRNVGCKKFFPTIARTLTVPCE